MASSDASGAVKYYPEEELAALVRSLDRPADQQLFSVDVLITYPNLAEQYVRVCPQRCDLTTAAQKALDGDYSHDQKLETLKADVQLMVNNCVRFNGDDHPLSEVAANFEKFAMEKIDRYLTGKAGGRRVSSLRLQQQLSQAPPQPASTPARGTSTAAANGSSRQAHKGAASASPVTHARHKELTKGDVVSLVKDLVRREDAKAFEVDVAEVYPELKENYEKVCPNKMNLVMMREKAEKGAYNTTLSAIGASVAESLVDVRADVELIVNNCIRFNSQLPDWVRLAELFRKFAHRRIDDLVLRVAPSLRGTKTGAQLYASGAAPPSATATQSGPEVVQVSSDSTATPASAAATPGTKRLRLHDDEGRNTAAAVAAAYEGPHVVEVVTVAPSVCPTPLQPALEIPERLRRRLIADHLCRDQRRARLTGRTAPFVELFPPAVVSATTPPPSAATDGSSTDPKAEAAPAPTASTADASVKPEPAADVAPTETTTTAAVPPPSADWAVTLTSDQSAQALIDGFRASIHRFYETKRHAPDFNDPFQFSLQDEALYIKMLDTVEQQLESVFLGALLYAQEAADIHEWVSLQALQRAQSGASEKATGASDTAQDESSDGGAPTPVRWAPAIHYTYLVRFLAQLPQMASLCSASLSTPSGAQTPVVKVSREALTMLRRVTQFTEEFLTFIAQYEETLLGSADMTKPLTEPQVTA